MAAATVMMLKDKFPQLIKLHHFTPVRNVMLGAGLAFAFEQNKLWHLPAVILVPSIYAGYQAFKARDQIRAFALNPKSYAAGPTEV
jgi:hypothetical protein